MGNGKKDNFSKWVILLSVVLGTFMVVLDSSIVNVAIPKMMSVFGVSLDRIQWVLSAYTMALGGVVPISGYLVDRFGIKKIYVLALLLFTLGSVLCGLAWSCPAMIVFRILQGLGGGMLVPLSMTLIYRNYPVEERGVAMGLWGIANAFAPALGPTLSGYLVQSLDWRLIFLINAPIGIIAVILIVLLLEESELIKGKSLDLIGFISSAAGLVCILYVVGEGSDVDWGAFKNVMLLTLGAFSLAIFVVNELTHREPLIELRILKSMAFTFSVLINCCVTVIYIASIFIVPVLLQNLLGHTAMQTGLILLPGALVTGITMLIAGRLYNKTGPKPLIIAGIIILIWNSYQFSRISLDISDAGVTALMAIRGLGFGLTMMPSLNLAMERVPQHLTSMGSTLLNTIRQVSLSLGIAVVTTIMQNRMNISYSKLAEQMDVFNIFYPNTANAVLGRFSENMAVVPPDQKTGVVQYVLYALEQKQAYTLAINDVFYILSACTVAALALILVLRYKKQPGSGSDRPVVMD